MAFEARIIKDSICNNHRLTTMQVTHPRIIHAEVNTHRMFSENASSSRAVPFAVTVKRIQADPFIPIYWGENQSGMSARKEISDWKKVQAEKLWLEARDKMVDVASKLTAKECPVCKGNKGWETPTGGHTFVVCSECNGTGEGINLHKQIVNRLTETWAWITVCITGDADAWSNYFALRCHPDAQPEIQHQAYLAQREYFTTYPTTLNIGEWHTPYIKNEEVQDIIERAQFHNKPCIDAVNEISTGRCARTSYLTQEGIRDLDEDIKLHDRLRDHVPLHASPFEHVCQAMGDDNKYAMYTGWKSYRQFIPQEYVTNFKPNYEEYFSLNTQ